MPGRLGHKGRAVPELLRITPSGVERVASRRREMAVIVHLPDFVRDRLDGRVASDAAQDRRRPAADRLVITIRNRQMNARIAIGRGAEKNSFFAESHAPGVVVGVAKKLHLRIPLTPCPSPPKGEGSLRGSKAVEPLAKRMPFAADLSFKP